jgi:hypothetical protein
MSFTARIALASAIVIFDLVVFILPLGAVLLAYVLLFRPAWFPVWVERLYRFP